MVQQPPTKDDCCEKCGAHRQGPLSQSERDDTPIDYIPGTSPRIPITEARTSPRPLDAQAQPPPYAPTQHATPSNGHGSPVPPGNSMYPLKTITSASAPYGMQSVYSPAQSSISSPQSYTKVSSPLSDNVSPSSTDSYFDTNSPQSMSGIAAFPGTMTSNNQHTPRKSRPSRKTVERKPSLAQRGKAALRGMFTHRPLDKTQLQPIEATHWTD